MCQKISGQIYGEKLGVSAAELRYMAQNGISDFDEMTWSILAKEAFSHGLLPIPLRQQVRLMDPTSLGEALDQALAVKEIVIEDRGTFNGISG